MLTWGHNSYVCIFSWIKYGWDILYIQSKYLWKSTYFICTAPCDTTACALHAQITCRG